MSSNNYSPHSNIFEEKKQKQKESITSTKKHFLKNINTSKIDISNGNWCLFSYHSYFYTFIHSGIDNTKDILGKQKNLNFVFCSFNYLLQKTLIFAFCSFNYLFTM